MACRSRTVRSRTSDCQRGKRLLSEADVIVYDRLAGQGVLTYGADMQNILM